MFRVAADEPHRDHLSWPCLEADDQVRSLVLTKIEEANTKAQRRSKSASRPTDGLSLMDVALASVAASACQGGVETRRAVVVFGLACSLCTRHVCHRVYFAMPAR